MLQVSERELELAWRLPPAKLEEQAMASLGEEESIVRCVFGEKSAELGIVNAALPHRTPFEFLAREQEDHDTFNAAFIVPTGVGAAQGGHAGDATPVLKAMATIADTIFTHPNVVNASDINEIPANALYIEGSLLSSFLMGRVGLARRKRNRVLVLIDSRAEEKYINAAVNTVNGARSTYGFDCSAIISLPITTRGSWSASGRASGEISGPDALLSLLQQQRHTYDAIAVTSVIDIDPAMRNHYLVASSRGEAVNPWGGVEAMLTHAISMATDTPSAHAPMESSQETEDLDFGVVDARIAAEMISFTYFQCVLKGLQRSPVVSYNLTNPHTLTANNVNVLVIPKGCFGLPVYAALHQGIKVIAVADKIHAANQTKLVRSLPWQKDQYYEVANYREALGALACLKAGMPLAAITRPLATMQTTLPQTQRTKQAKKPIRSAVAGS
jgi:hypothetical protein